MSNEKSNTTAIRMCQQEIVKHDLQVKACIQDIRDCAPNADDLNILNLQISEDMRALKSGIEDLERLAMEQDLESHKKELLQEASKYRKQLASNQAALRKANLACQTLIDRQNKEELFHQRSEKPRQRTKADKESLARQSSAVTDSLVALNSIMSLRVKQSEDTLQTLVHSSSSITDTNEELKNMGSIVGQSRKLLNKYGRREVTDKVLIVMVVLFFFTCVIYVIHKRLF